MNRFELMRYERGLTVAEVVEQSGVSARTIARLESGAQFKPNAATAKALADFYEITVAQVLGLDEAEAAA